MTSRPEPWDTLAPAKAQVIMRGEMVELGLPENCF